MVISSECVFLSLLSAFSYLKISKSNFEAYIFNAYSFSIIPLPLAPGSFPPCEGIGKSQNYLFITKIQNSILFQYLLFLHF